MNDRREIEFYDSRRSKATVLRVYTDGGIVDIHVGLRTEAGRTITRVDVQADGPDRGGDISGRIWRIIPGDALGVSRMECLGRTSEADAILAAEAEQARIDANPSRPVELTWTTSASADDENHDQETDLDAIGSPGGASWASVSPDSRPGAGPWAWVIYDRWNDVDEHDSVLGGGPADSEDAAKAAVAAWVRRERIRAARYGAMAPLPPMPATQAEGVEHVLAAVNGEVFRSAEGGVIVMLTDDPYAISVDKGGHFVSTNLVTVSPAEVAQAMDADEGEIGGWSTGYDI